MHRTEDLAGSEKKSYEAPKLVVHGNVEKLTGWKGSGVSDFPLDEDLLGNGS